MAVDANANAPGFAIADEAVVISNRDVKAICEYIESRGEVLSGVSTIIDRLSAYASPLLLFAASESPKLLKNNGVPSWFVVSSLSSYSVAMTVIWLTFSFYASRFWIPYQNVLIN